MGRFIPAGVHTHAHGEAEPDMHEGLRLTYRGHLHPQGSAGDGEGGTGVSHDSGQVLGQPPEQVTSSALL